MPTPLLWLHDLKKSIIAKCLSESLGRRLCFLPRDTSHIWFLSASKYLRLVTSMVHQLGALRAQLTPPRRRFVTPSRTCVAETSWSISTNSSGA